MGSNDDKLDGKSRRGSGATSVHARDTKFPFFMWNVSGDGKDTGDLARDRRVAWLLTKVDTALCTKDLMGKLYRESYRCPLAELKQRHPDWDDATTEPTAGHKESVASPSTGDDAEHTQDPIGNSSESKAKQTSDPAKWDTVKLLRLSKELLELFVPLDFQLHPVIERYWGSLDRILRVSPLKLTNLCATGSNSSSIL